jgi:hypothetical protein
MGFWMVIGFTDHLDVSTSNYTALANSCTLLLTTAHSKSSQIVFTSRFLVMDPNNVLCLRSYWLTNVHKLNKLKSEAKSHCDWQSVSQSIFVSSPMWSHDLILVPVWHLLSCPCEAPSLRRGRVSPLSVTVRSDKSIVSMYNVFTCYMLLKVCIYNIHKASVSSVSVKQNVPYRQKLPLQRQSSHLNGRMLDRRHWQNWVWVLCYDRRPVGQSVLE